MPAFFSDAVGGFHEVWLLALAFWASLPQSTRVLVALMLSGGLVYAASKAEETSWSALLFFGAFAIFGYVMFVGYSLLQ